MKEHNLEGLLHVAIGGAAVIGGLGACALGITEAFPKDVPADLYNEMIWDGGVIAFCGAACTFYGIMKNIMYRDVWMNDNWRKY